MNQGSRQETQCEQLNRKMDLCPGLEKMTALNSRAQLNKHDLRQARSAPIPFVTTESSPIEKAIDFTAPMIQHDVRVNADSSLRSFVEQPKSWSRWAKKRRGRFSSHNWKQKRLITKNIVGEIKQLDESDEGTVVFVSL